MLQKQFAAEAILAVKSGYEDHPIYAHPDKLCVVATAPPHGSAVSPTRLQGGVAPVDPHKGGHSPPVDPRKKHGGNRHER